LQSFIHYLSSFKYCCFEQADKKVDLNEAVLHNFSLSFLKMTFIKQESLSEEQ